MRTKSPQDSWTVLTHFEWSSQTELVVALASALDNLDSVDDTAVVYDYIDPEAVTAAFGEPGHDRGIHEIRFDCEGHEIQITDNGIIAARSQSASRTRSA
jgi:hypothetical protein